MAPVTTIVARKWGNGVLEWVEEKAAEEITRNKKFSGKGAPLSTSYSTVEVTKWSLPSLVGTYCDLSHLYMPYSQPLHERQLLSKDVLYVISFSRLFTCSGLLCQIFLNIELHHLGQIPKLFFSSHFILPDTTNSPTHINKNTPQ